MKIILTESQYFRIVEQRGGHNKLDTQKFIEKSQKIHSDESGEPKYDYSLVDYQGSGVPVKIICDRHKDKWKEDTGNEYFLMRPSKHLGGQGCKYDYLESTMKYSDSDLKKEANKYKTTAEFKKNSFLHFNSAQKRGEDFYKSITSHFVPEKESAGEKLIAKILVDEGLIDPSCEKSRNCVNREKSFDDCLNTKKGRYCRKLRFDFYLPDLNTIIEYDGEQHFRPSKKFGGEKYETTLENDRIKNEYCRKNGINLVRVKYDVGPNEIKEELLDALKNPKMLTFIGDYD